MHDDVIKHLSRYWPFVRGIHRWPMDSPHKGQSRRALICPWTNGWRNNRDAGDLRRHRAHYDVTIMHVHCSVLQCFIEFILEFKKSLKISYELWLNSNGCLMSVIFFFIKIFWTPSSSCRPRVVVAVIFNHYVWAQIDPINFYMCISWCPTFFPIIRRMTHLNDFCIPVNPDQNLICPYFGNLM